MEVSTLAVVPVELPSEPEFVESEVKPAPLFCSGT